jgi:hypothetical protein
MVCLWQCHMDGDLCKDYEPEVSTGLDEAMADGMESVKIAGNWAWRNYTFVLNWRFSHGMWECHAYQRNDESLKVRAIRRITVVVDRGD